MSKVYPSKTDWWVSLLFWLLIANLVWEVFQAFLASTPANSSFALQTLVLLTLIVAAVFAFFFPIRYELNSAELCIKSGLFIRQKIFLASITSTEPSRNTAASFALSLDRIMIRFSRGETEEFTLVSPRDKNDFLSSLAESVPNLR